MTPDVSIVSPKPNPPKRSSPTAVPFIRCPRSNSPEKSRKRCALNSPRREISSNFEKRKKKHFRTIIFIARGKKLAFNPSGIFRHSFDTFRKINKLSGDCVLFFISKQQRNTHIRDGHFWKTPEICAQRRAVIHFQGAKKKRNPPGGSGIRVCSRNK